MTADPLEPGALLEGKYKIVGVVGEGAWGQVLEGVNVRIQRRVAIKILKAEYAANEQMVGRFEREARASTHIESPHVVQVFDAGVLPDGRPYLVMEFLTGEDLSTRIASEGGKLPIVTSVNLCIQIARGLAAAHSASVFHRDMKPSNIVIAKTKSGRQIAKIVDFGISKLLDVSKGEVSNTQTGTVLGSPAYMSPEQARGSKQTDHRSDIYSLGVVLFECLTGTTPHTADGFNELLFKIVLEPPPSAQSLRPEIDEELGSIITHVLAKDPELRVQTASDLEGLLLNWLTKNGDRTSDWDEASNPRLPVDLTSSPVVAARGLDSGALRSARSSPELLATVPVGPDGMPGLATASDPPSQPGSDPAPVKRSDDVVAPKAVHSPLESSLTPSSASPVRTLAPGRQRWMVPALAAVGVVVIVVGIALGSASSTSSSSSSSSPGAALVPPPAASVPVVSIPSAPSAGANAVATATAGAGASASASPDASEGTGVAAAAGVAAAGSHVTAPTVVPRPSATAIARPKSTVSTAPSTAPPAGSANPASVGGRTIRTDL